MRSRVVCIAILAASLFAKDPTEWKQSKLLNIDIGSQSRVHGYGGTIHTNVQSVFAYKVDGGDLVYDGRVNGRPIHVEVNASVQYAVDKDHLYIKDSEGKSHKLDLVRTTRKE